MGRLIEADNLKRYIIETYHDPIIVCNDEVHFVAEIIDDYPTVEAIPKDQYEARLKAEKVSMFEEIQLEIEESENCGKAFHLGLQMASNIIQQKIDKLKENKDGKNDG